MENKIRHDMVTGDNIARGFRGLGVFGCGVWRFGSGVCLGLRNAQNNCLEP